jgi:hypothetical protein
MAAQTSQGALSRDASHDQVFLDLRSALADLRDLERRRARSRVIPAIALPPHARDNARARDSITNVPNAN